MKSERYPIEQSKWFLVNRGTHEYKDYGFKSKTQAMNDVSFLNASDRAAGKLGEWAVVPSPPRPPPELKVLKGGKAS